MKLNHRTLDFTSLDEVLADIENLDAAGYERAGKWDLNQVVGHLIEWIRYPMDGYPKMNPVMRFLMWGLRNTIGQSQKRKVLTTRRFPAGGPTVPETVPAAGGDAKASVKSMRSLVERIKAFDGKIHPSPLFGSMTRDEWIQLNLIHCAHHLSFLLPKSG